MEQVWFVGFTHASAAWYHRFLKRGYRHCFAFTCLGIDRWLVIDALWNGMRVDEVPGKTIDAIVAECTSVLAVKVKPRPVRFRLLATCVTLCAHLTGDRSRAVTPWQLYRSLRANGAERVFYRSR